MSHVFVSYSRQDSAFVETLREQLTASGFEVWTDSVVRPGNDWRQEIDDAIRQAFVMLVIVTPASKSSEYVTYEWAFALGLGVRVIPLIVEPAELHSRLQFLQHIDMTRWQGEDLPWARLLEGLNQIKADDRNHTIPGHPAQAPAGLSTARMNAPGIWLVVQEGPLPGQKWNLNQDIITVGRDLTNVIVLNDQQISRRHARFIRDKQGYMTTFTLEDLESSNGTYVNSERLSAPCMLRDGDVIQFGDTITLVYQIVM